MHPIPSLTYIVWGNEISSRLFKVGLDVFPEKVFHMWCIKCVIDLDGFCYSEPNRNESLFSSSFKQSFVNPFKKKPIHFVFCLEYITCLKFEIKSACSFYALWNLHFNLWHLNALFRFKEISNLVKDITSSIFKFLVIIIVMHIAFLDF